MYIALLGRQPALGMAELERVYGSEHTRWFSNESARIDTDVFDFDRLGGSLKAGQIVETLKGSWRDASAAILARYESAWAHADHKRTLGISAYGFPVSARDVQQTGIQLKQRLKKTGSSIRLIPNDYPALNTATSHHNKLGLSDNKIELIVIRAGDGSVVIAESVGAQNITAFAARDQARPKTDAFVGMLPPKLARMMINLSGISDGASGEQGQNAKKTILDPFCGTGVVLQEALLDGFRVIGSDLSAKMVDYSTENLRWIAEKRHLSADMSVHQADAMHDAWLSPIDAVVSETYLGQPFSAPPRPEKLADVRGNCDHIVGSFLKNIAAQIRPGTPVIIAVPAWRSASGSFTHLPLIQKLDSFGFTRVHLEHVRDDQLLYYRENQVVARELLLLVKA